MVHESHLSVYEAIGENLQEVQEKDQTEVKGEEVGGKKEEVRHELVLRYKWVGPMERAGIPVKSEMALRNKMITQMTWKRWHGKMVT